MPKQFCLEQAQLELKLERQNKFATNQQKEEDNATDDAKAADESSAANQPKKRGAPVGHPGWFRPTPTHYDWSVDVPAPRRCPHCQGHVTAQTSLPPVEHLQEDIISRIGPYLRSRAVWLRNVIGISYRRPTHSRRCPTDCYVGYAASVAGAKQKCLAHLARTARRPTPTMLRTVPGRCQAEADGSRLDRLCFLCRHQAVCQTRVQFLSPPSRRQTEPQEASSREGLVACRIIATRNVRREP
ncbi:MAG: hypothetical protein O3C40_26480 [Planctomycetota bacterium]|nr:hypothetical protein [Planctomycetota bacterium]